LGKRIAAAALLFFLCALIPAAGQQALKPEIENLGLSFRWDPYLGIGVLERGGHSLRFGLDGSYYLLDGNEIGSGSVTRNKEGSLVADQPFITALRGHFPVSDVSAVSVTTIIIDPGHGGKDPGAVGRHTIDGKPYVIKEKDIVLEVAKELYSMLSKNYPEKRIMLTRNDDVYPTLEERTEIANSVELGENEAMVFISIHANASFNSKASGFEVWYLPPDYRRELIDPESIDPNAREVAPILNTMLEEEYTVESILLARSVSAGMEQMIGDKSENRGLKEESWFVVRNAKMPSVLIELGFVTNPEEARSLGDAGYLKKLTQGIYNGVVGFINRFGE
jgi:N-acetylmuramoyl-L-alanine amidase